VRTVSGAESTALLSEAAPLSAAELLFAAELLESVLLLEQPVKAAVTTARAAIVAKNFFIFLFPFHIS
jgi:hypothetical protein